LFREAVIAFLGAGKNGDKAPCGPRKREECRQLHGEFADWACERCEENPLRKSHDA
jgi:NAD-dependent SIR2 family protein deacetylase